jgi:hypothetical protein
MASTDSSAAEVSTCLLPVPIPLTSAICLADDEEEKVLVRWNGVDHDSAAEPRYGEFSVAIRRRGSDASGVGKRERHVSVVSDSASATAIPSTWCRSGEVVLADILASSREGGPCGTPLQERQRRVQAIGRFRP